jgi:hypothetical protein
MWLNMNVFNESVQEAEASAQALAGDPDGQLRWAKERRERDKQVFLLIRANTPKVETYAPEERAYLTRRDPDLPSLFELSPDLQKLLQVAFPEWEI